jgi:hypothetical protein
MFKGAKVLLHGEKFGTIQSVCLLDDGIRVIIKLDVTCYIYLDSKTLARFPVFGYGALSHIIVHKDNLEEINSGVYNLLSA